MTEVHQQGGTRERSTGTKAPLVSIIVVVFKDRVELEKLIDNLAPFRGPDLEVVVIDGGSKDGSLELLQTNDDRIDYWLSEPDKGLYDGMNKGLAASRGEWVLHINAGDRLLSPPYEELRMLDKNVAMFGCCVECPTDGFTFIARMNWTFRFQSTLHHQGTFYRRSLHCGYDPTYRILGDVAATQRIVRQGKQVAVSPHVVALHEGGGMSDLPGNDREWQRSIRENYGVLHQIAHKLLFLPARKVYRSTRKRLK
jgi:glycosyltransferase involved in cell wall biosynthesis